MEVKLLHPEKAFEYISCRLLPKLMDFNWSQSSKAAPPIHNNVLGKVMDVMGKP